MGEVLGCNDNGLVEIDVKNKFCIGYLFEFMMLKGNINFKLDFMENKKGEVISDVKGLGYIVKIFLLEDIDLDYVILMCNFDVN